MLVLSRKAGEEILIGEEISIQIIAIQGDKVRIGIEAPRSVRVLRAELAGVIRDDHASETGVSHAG